MSAMGRAGDPCETGFVLTPGLLRRRKNEIATLSGPHISPGGPPGFVLSMCACPSRWRTERQRQHKRKYFHNLRGRNHCERKPLSFEVRRVSQWRAAE